MSPRSETQRECLFGIADGEVIAVMPMGDASTMFAREPTMTEVVRMPVEAAGRFMFQAWPGRDAALALLAQEDARHD